MSRAVQDDSERTVRFPAPIILVASIAVIVAIGVFGKGFTSHRLVQPADALAAFAELAHAPPTQLDATNSNPYDAIEKRCLQSIYPSAPEGLTLFGQGGVLYLYMMACYSGFDNRHGYEWIPEWHNVDVQLENATRMCSGEVRGHPHRQPACSSDDAEEMRESGFKNYFDDSGNTVEPDPCDPSGIRVIKKPYADDESDKCRACIKKAVDSSLHACAANTLPPWVMDLLMCAKKGISEHPACLLSRKRNHKQPSNCIEGAVVGHCLLKGCFKWLHGPGESHCELTSCKCSPGFCSFDQKTCVPEATTMLATNETLSVSALTTYLQYSWRSNPQAAPAYLTVVLNGIVALILGMGLVKAARWQRNGISEPLLHG